MGAVAVVQDLTAEENLRQKQDLLERTAFWTDLAASMSHEIRNPLVAIKTFAQLLPERFDDADFRKEFNEIVIGEVDQQSGKLLKDSLRVVDDKKPEEDPILSLSNFFAREDRQTKEVVIHMTRWFPYSNGWEGDAYLYRISV